MVSPDFGLEARVAGPVAGIDEAGRGPWAGPVVAAAVILNLEHAPAGLRDSKQLSRTARESLYLELSHSARIGVGAASVAEIDALNILAATMLAMRRALVRLRTIPTLALVDGNRAPDLPCPVKTVVRGDATSASIAAASIVAKVMRDRLMTRLARAHPGFGWERNAGYGTAEHRMGLHRHGVTCHHRKSFAPVRDFLSARSPITH